MVVYPALEDTSLSRYRDGSGEWYGSVYASEGNVGLELHSDKTRIVYRKDANRRGEFEHSSFDFLGYTTVD